MSSDVAGIPERVGRYDVVLPLRTDDRGAAYLARASGLGGFDRFVVLEIAAKAFQDRADFSKLVIDEATRVANLRHTNVVPVYDVGEDQAGVFLVAEYVPGSTLADLKGAPKDVALRIVVDALHGLHAAHEHADEEGRSFNLVHGDFAPSSIVVGTDGIARIADLPLARAARRASKPLGDRFASPERVRGEDLDRRADVWSAAALVWEILTGTTFATSDDGDPPRVKSVEGAAGIADEIDVAVAGALKNDKASRTATCAAFAKELTTAARAAGMFAEVDRVAEHVKTIAGPDLEKRREKLKEPAKKAEEEKKPTMIGVSSVTGVEVPDEGKRDEAETPEDKPAPKAPRPLALPEVPEAPLKVIDSPISVLALEVDLSAYRGDRANTALLGAVSTSDVADAKDAAPAEAKVDGGGEEDKEIYRSPVAVGPTTGEAKGGSLFAAPLAKHEKIAIAVGGALLVVALGIGIARCGSSPSSGASGLVAGSSSASGATSLASASTTGSGAAARSGVLHVTANGSIARVVIGERAIEILDADTTADVDLTPAERNKTLKVFVTSTEGRVATATVDPGVRGIDVVFGDRDTLPPPPPPPGGSAAHASSAGATHVTAPAGGGGGGSSGGKRTWPKRGPRK